CENKIGIWMGKKIPLGAVTRPLTKKTSRSDRDLGLVSLERLIRICLFGMEKSLYPGNIGLTSRTEQHQPGQQCKGCQAYDRDLLDADTPHDEQQYTYTEQHQCSGKVGQRNKYKGPANRAHYREECFPDILYILW